MHVGELLYRVSKHGASLRCGRTEDRLSYSPGGALPLELIAELKDHKQEIIQILREDEKLRHTGVIQSEREVFDLAQEFFGPSCPFDPSKHPPSKRELWVDEDKEAFFFPHRYPGGEGE